MALSTHTSCGLVSNVYIDIGYGVYLDVRQIDRTRTQTIRRYSDKDDKKTHFRS